ncbi:MAG TPA: protease inhibitor I42 family protein [Nitrososphaerales archaeon]|nr:protease inhibitor I42 family protein [Nitrososphaerales archaeon]
MVRKYALIALILAAVITVSALAYQELGGNSNRTTSSTRPPQSSISTIITNGSSVYVYPTSNLSSTISPSVGKVFGVQLSSNAGSTGYDWNVSTGAGIQYLNYTVVSTSTLAGGPQVRDYWFRATQGGNQSITLQDVRQFAPHDVHATIHLLVTNPSSGFNPNQASLAGGGPQLVVLSYIFSGKQHQRHPVHDFQGLF